VAQYRQYFAAPPTRAQVTGWTGQFPGANTALLLPPSRLLGIDCDSRDAEAEAQSRGLPRTYSVRTHHGSHFYYRRPALCPVTRVTKAGGARGIDVLTHGVLIAPPSRHRLGSVYSVVDPAAPLADPPDWAVAWLREAPPPATARPPAPSALPADLPTVALADLAVSPRLRQLIVTGADPIRYPSLSEARFAVLGGLIAAGYADAVITAVCFDPAHGISTTPRARGRPWFAQELARARAKADVEIFA
jgi:hypothetical protein